MTYEGEVKLIIYVTGNATIIWEDEYGVWWGAGTSGKTRDYDS
jgi:hypothetical protein